MVICKRAAPGLWLIMVNIGHDRFYLGEVQKVYMGQKGFQICAAVAMNWVVSPAEKWVEKRLNFSGWGR